MKPKRRARSSGVVVPNAITWYQRLGARVIWLVFRLVSATVRYSIDDPHGFLRAEQVPVIFCVWHNRLALCMKLYSVFGCRHRHPRGMAALVSASKDGSLLAAILECFRVQPVRGSTSRRGPQALLELTTWTERGYDLAITPDGPRGPRYVVQPGVMSLAQVTGHQVVPSSYHLNWKIQLKSWDRFQIPLPFARCKVTVGRRFHVPREATDDEREALRKQLEDELRAISRD